jgi:hypothetical protein
LEKHETYPPWISTSGSGRGRWLTEETAKWAKVVKFSGAKPD